MAYEEAVAWAGECVGSSVVARRPLLGGWSSTMLALKHASGTRTVLRLIDRDPWKRFGATLAIREHETQIALQTTSLPAPQSLGLDAAGSVCGVAAHLMTMLPGEVVDRSDAAGLEALARLLAEIHEVRPVTWPRGYQSWATEEKFVLPQWSERAKLWGAAFEVLRGEPPPYEPVFLHRDFGPHNILRSGDSIAGIVDWVETSTGPAWLDVAHCASNLAIRSGDAAASEFVARYRSLTGRRGDAHWEVMDIVGYLPQPGRLVMREPEDLRRLEGLLATALERL